jgi:hypothetical protein
MPIMRRIEDGIAFSNDFTDLSNFSDFRDNGRTVSRPLFNSGYKRMWREALIQRVWSRLVTYEATRPKDHYATALQLRVANPEASLEETAQRFGQQTNCRVTAAGFQKTLQRARVKFLELLIEDLRKTIRPATPEDIKAEIFDLGLGNLYRRYANHGAV